MTHGLPKRFTEEIRAARQAEQRAVFADTEAEQRRQQETAAEMARRQEVIDIARALGPLAAEQVSAKTEPLSTVHTTPRGFLRRVTNSMAKNYFEPVGRGWDIDQAYGSIPYAEMTYSNPNGTSLPAPLAAVRLMTDGRLVSYHSLIGVNESVLPENCLELASPGDDPLQLRNGHKQITYDSIRSGLAQFAAENKLDLS